jgi:hypothetical protein
MIRSLDDFSRIAREKGPKKLAVLAPEDEDFMLALKTSWQKGYIEPVLIGNTEKMERVAEKVEFDIGSFEKIIGDDRQAIADLGINMLFTGRVAIVSKGQIPTSYIYRSIIWLPSRIQVSASSRISRRRQRFSRTLFLSIIFWGIRNHRSLSFPARGRLEVC